jgi:hypothetical protein
MNSELTQKLLSRFPTLYRKYYEPPEISCMCWGFAVGNGWFDIIWDLSLAIENEGVVVEQVKEKFGLRFYYEPHSPEIEELIDKACCLADITCSMCGALGESRDSWCALCEKCWGEQKRRIQEFEFLSPEEKMKLWGPLK